jgi:hypothetical protein
MAGRYRAQAGCFAVGCAILVVVAVAIGINQRSLIAEQNSWPETTGTLTRVWVETHATGFSDDDTRIDEHYAAFAFDAGGRRVTAQQHVTASMRKNVGDLVRVRYSPQQAEYARIEGELQSSYGTTIFLGVSAIVGTTLSAAYLIMTKRSAHE